MNLPLLRCKFTGHLWNNTSEIISPTPGQPYYIVHISCIRCGKAKKLEAQTGKLPSRDQP